MKLHKLLVLIGVLAALAAAAALKHAADRREAARDADAAREIVRLAPGLSPASVSKLVIRRESDPPASIVLQKSLDAGWSMPSHYGIRARGGQMDTFLKGLSELKGEVRSDAPEALADFLLTDASGIHVEAFGEGEVLLGHWVLSPLRAGRAEIFVRRSGSDQAVLAAPDLLSLMGVFQKTSPPDYKYFADLKVVPFDLATMDRIELFHADGSSTIFARQGESGVWGIEGGASGKETDKSKISQLLVQLTNLHAREVSPPSGWVQGRPLLKVRRKGDPPAEIEASAGPLEERTQTHLVKVLPAGSVWIVQESDLKALLGYKGRSDFEK